MYKLYDRLILNRITYIVDQQLPPKQAGFRMNRCTIDQVVHLTRDTEDSLQKREKARVVLMDMTAAYDTVWLQGLEYKLLQMVADRRMVAFISNFISNRTFVVCSSKGERSLRNRLRNCFPQDSVLALTPQHLCIRCATHHNHKIYVC